MRRGLALLVCLAPTLAYGQQTYTNADLVNIQVPGAYTNDDLRSLTPLAVQRQPANTLPTYVPPPGPGDFYQGRYDGLRAARQALAAELQYENERVEFSESAFAGDTRSFEPRLGYRARVRPFMLELGRRIALLYLQMQDIADAARRAGAPLDVR